MHYFVKDNKLHRYPVSPRCKVQYSSEPLRDTIPHNIDECIYCMGWWPGD